MTVAVAVFTDGRWDVLARTLDSAEEHLHGNIEQRVLFVDGAPPELELHTRLEEVFDTRDRSLWTVVVWERRYGFAGTIEAAWRFLSGHCGEEYVFHLEDDFVFTRPVDLAAMSEVLAAHPHLAQLALRRQPWNEAERAAGGIVEQWPDAYDDLEDGAHAWLEHRLFFTTNPSLYRRELCTRGWPLVKRSEGRFSTDLFADPDVRCGFWGARDSGEAVHHIGAERVGTGY